MNWCYSCCFYAPESLVIAPVCFTLHDVFCLFYVHVFKVKLLFWNSSYSSLFLFTFCAILYFTTFHREIFEFLLCYMYFKIGVTFQIKTTNMRSSYKIQFMKDETSDWSSLSQMFNLNKCLNQRNDWKYFTKNQILEKIFSDIWVAEFSFFLLSSPRSSSHDLSDGFCDQTNWTWCS